MKGLFEKKYNDALGWMRKVYPTLTGADKEDAEHFFPELKESENERIRNDIMEAVENWLPYERVEEIRAYLEKQKEQKPAEWSEEDENRFELLMAMCEDGQNESSPISTNYREMQETKDWLKNRFKFLRHQPHWKPSEEQMAVLEIACKYEGVFTQGQLSALLDLKEQLKKL